MAFLSRLGAVLFGACAFVATIIFGFVVARDGMGTQGVTSDEWVVIVLAALVATFIIVRTWVWICLGGQS